MKLTWKYGGDVTLDLQLAEVVDGSHVDRYTRDGERANIIIIIIILEMNKRSEGRCGCGRRT